MGIHKEFIDAANYLNIKIVFTSHDYYGICPKVNLITNDQKVCNDYKNGESCIECNSNGYKTSLIYIMQSKIYRDFKESKDHRFKSGLPY